MKTRKKIMLSALSILATFFAVLFGLKNAPTAKAGTTTPYIDVTYETYLLDDYEKMSEWDASFLDYVYNGIYFGSWPTPTAVGKYKIDQSALSADIAAANDCWDGTDSSYPIMVGSKTAYQYFGGYPFDLLSAASVTEVYLNSVSAGRSGFKIDTANPLFEDYNVFNKTTTTFSPNDKIVIAEYVEGHSAYKDVATYMDLEFVTSTQTQPLTKACNTVAANKVASASAISNSSQWYAWNVTGYGGPYNKMVPNVSGTYSTSGGGSSTTKTLFMGGGGSTDSTTFSTKDVSYAVAVQIDANANGTYVIEPANTNLSKYILSSTQTFTYISGAAHWNVTPLNIQVNGASNETKMDSLTVDGTAVTLPSTQSPYAEYTQVAAGTAIAAGTTYYKAGAGGMVAASFAATVSVIPSDTEYYTKASASGSPITATAKAASSTADIVGSVDKRGTVLGVTYSVSTSSTAATAALALTGSVAGANAAGTGYNVPQYNAGTKMYAAITTQSQDKTKVATYVIEITRDKYNLAEMQSINMSATGGGSGITTVTLYNAGATATATFNGNASNTYTIKVPGDATGIDVTPTWITSSDATKYMVVKVDDGSTVTTIDSTTTFVNVSTSLTQFKVTITSQDGSVTKTFTYKISKLSADNKIKDTTSYVKVESTNIYLNNTSVTYNSTTKTYTIPSSLVKYANTSFDLKIDANHSAAKVQIGTATATTGTQSKNGNAFNNLPTGASPNYLADLVTVTVRVQSESGATETYTIEVNKAAASSDATLTSLVAYDSTNAVVALDNPFSNSTTAYVSSADVAYNMTYFYVKATVTDSTAKVVCTKDSGSGTFGTGGTTKSGLVYTSPTLGFYGGPAAADTTEVIKITVTAEDTTTKVFTVKVTKAAADNDESFTVSAVDNLGNTVNLAFNSATNTWATTSNISKKADSVDYTLTINSATTNAYVTSVSAANKITGTKTQNLTISPTVAGAKTTVTLIITTQANTSGVTYTLEFVCDIRDVDYSINAATVKGNSDGVTYPSTVSGTTYTYTIPKSSAGNDFDIFIKTTNANAKVFISTTLSDLSGTPYLNNKYGVTTGSTYAGTLMTYNVATGEWEGTYAIDQIYYIKIYSEYGLTHTSSSPKVCETYTFNVKAKDERDTDNTITNISVSGNQDILDQNWTFSSGTATQAQINVLYTTTSIDFTVVTNNNKSKVYLSKAAINTSILAPTVTNGATISNCQGGSNATINLSVGDNYVYIQCQSEKETYNSIQYKVKIVRAAASGDNNVTLLKVGGVDYTSQIDQVMIIPVTSASPVVVFDISNLATCSATYKIGSVTSTAVTASPLNVTGIGYGSANNGYALVEIKVLAQSDSANIALAKPYKFYLVYADTDVTINDIYIKEDSATGNDLADSTGATYTYNAATTNVTHNILFSAANPFIEVDAASTYASVTGAGLINVTKATTATTVNASVTITSDFYKIISGIVDLSSKLSNYSSQKITYKYKFVRAAASQDRSVTATLTYGGGAKDGTTDTITNGMTVLNLGAINSVKVSVTPTNSGAPITYSFPPVSNVAAGTDSNINITNITKAGDTLSVTLTVYSESDTAGLAGVTASPAIYTILLCYGNATLDNDASVRNITVVGDNGVTYLSNLTAGKYSYECNVPGTVTSVNITIAPNLNTATAQLDVDGAGYQSVGINTPLTYAVAASTTTAGLTTFKIQLTAQDTTTKSSVYTIEVKTAVVETTNTISGLKINNTAVAGFNPSQTTGYTFNVLNTVTTAVATFTKDGTNSTIVSNNADASNPLALNVGTNTVTIVIKSEAGVSNTYTVNVIRDGDTHLSSLEVFEAGDLTSNLISFAAGTNTYNVTPDLPYAKGDIVVNATEVDPTNVTMKITYGTSSTLMQSGDQITLKAGVTTTIKVTLTPASGATNARTYTINIKREKGSSDATIKSYVDEEGNSLAISNNVVLYTYTLPRSYGLSGSFNPVITLNDSKASFDMPTVTTYSYGLNTMVVKVTAEDGTKKDYTFKVYCVDTDASITDIILNDGDGNEVKDSSNNAQVSFVDTTTNYSVVIPYTVSTLSFNVSLGSTYSKIYINNKEYTNNSTFTPTVGTVTYKVYALSEYGQLNASGSNVKSAEYTITIKRNQASNVATLSSLKVMDGADDILASKGNVAFASGTKDYIIQNINNITAITIDATPTDSNAKVTGAGAKVLAAMSGSGSSAANYTFSYDIEVTAEDGTTKITYNVTMSRGVLDLSADNTISYIIVKDSSGNTYLDQSSFNSSTLSYPTFEIPFGTQSVTIEVGKTAASPSTISIGGQPASGNSRQIAVTSNMVNTTESYVVYATSQKGVDGTKYTISLKFLKAEENTALALLTVDGVSVKGFDPAKDTKQQIYNYTLDQVSNGKKNVIVMAIGAKPEAQTITINSQSINPYSVNLNEGYNQIVVVVRAESGAQATYVITIQRAYEDPKVIDIEVEGYDLLDSSDKATTFNAKNTVYHTIVPFTSNSVVGIKVVVENSYYVVSTTSTYNPVHNGTVWNFTTYSLAEGENYFTITITSTEGATISYTLVINKRGNDSVNTNLSLIRIAEIPAFESDYKNSETSYGTYQVGNKISDLTFTIITEITPSAKGAGATYKIFNDKNLKVGNNKVVVVIIAEDGQTSRTIIIDVERAAMEYTVDTTKIPYTTTTETTNNCYKVDLGATKLSSLTAKTFTDAITSSSNPNLEVTVLSDLTDDTLNEVLVKVSDGYTNEFVRFILQKDNVNVAVTPENGTYPTTPSTNPTLGIFASEYIINLGENLPTVLTLEDFKKYFSADVTVSLFSPTTITTTTEQVSVAVTNGLTTAYVNFKLTHDPLEFSVDLNATSYTTILVSNDVYEIDLGHDLPTVLQPAIIKSYITYDTIKYRAIVVNVDTIVNINTSEIYVTVNNNYESRTVKFMIKRAPVDLTVDLLATDYKTTADATLDNTYTINLGEDLPTTKLSVNYLKRYFTGANLTVSLLNPIVIADDTKQIVVSVTDGNSTGNVTFILVHDAINFTVDVNATGYTTTEDTTSTNRYFIDLVDAKPTALTSRLMTTYIDTDQKNTKSQVVGTITATTTEIVVRVYNLYNEEVFVTFELEHTPLADLYSVDTAATSYTTVADPDNANTYIIDLKNDAPNEKLSKVAMLGYILSTSSALKTEVLTTIDPSTTEIKVKVSDNYDSEVITFKLQRNDVDSTPDVSKGDYDTTIVGGDYVIDLGEELPTILKASNFAKYFDSSYTVSIVNPKTITASTTQVDVSITDGNTTGYATFTLVHDPLVYTVDTTATGYTTLITGDNTNTIDLGNNKVTVLTPALMASYIKYDSKYKAIKVTVKTTITDSTQVIIVKIENNYETAFETFNILVNTDLDLTVAKNDSQYSPTPTTGSTIGNEYDIALNGRKPTDILFSELEKTIKDKNGAVLTITPLTNVTDKTGEIYVMASTPHSSAIVKFNLVDDSLSYKVDFGNLEFNVTENAKHDAKYDKSFTIDLGKNSADAIKDYSAFITDVTAGGTVTVLSDTSKDDCHEVVVAVQKGEEIEYVQFILDTTSGTTTSLSWLIWVLLGVAILLLGVILVVVNKDKYGKIAKSRRR